MRKKLNPKDMLKLLRAGLSKFFRQDRTVNQAVNSRFA